MSPESLSDAYLLKNYLGGISRLKPEVFVGFFRHAYNHYGSQSLIKYASNSADILIAPYSVVSNDRGEVFPIEEAPTLAGYRKLNRIKVITDIQETSPVLIKVPEGIYNSAVYEWTDEQERGDFLKSIARIYGIPHTLCVLAMNGHSLDEACLELEKTLRYDKTTIRSLGSQVREKSHRVVVDLIAAKDKYYNGFGEPKFVGDWNSISDITKYSNRVPTDKSVMTLFLNLQQTLSDIVFDITGSNCAYEANSSRLIPININSGTINLILISQQEAKDIQYGIKLFGDYYYLLTAFVEANKVSPTDENTPYLGPIKYYEYKKSD